MLKPEDAVSLRHMLDAAGKAVQFSRGRSRSDLDADEMFALALVRLLEIIGEAAKRLSAELRQQCPGIPWKQIAGTRDRLIHGYFDVDLDIIWAIITDDLPVLTAELEKIIPLADSC
jgi:uncharacterized protein with HEPN domain